MLVLLFLIFLFGLIIGSFLNVVIFRLGTKKSALKGRSFCPHCKHTLAWYDLIPVLSFVLLKGQCRYCAKKISWQYPLVEIATGLLFLQTFVFVNFVRHAEFISASSVVDFGSATEMTTLIIQCGLLLAVGSLLIIIFVYDLKHYLIPDKIIFPAIAIAFLYRISLQSTVYGLRPSVGAKLLTLTTFYPLFAAFGAATFFLLLVLITRGKGMGIGDIKLAFLMGLLLSWPQITTALSIAFLSGGLIGLALILTRKKKLKSMVPFGPFLASGTIIALFWGEKIINWYWKILL